MSKKYQYFANKRNSFLYNGARDVAICKFKKSHFYTSNCNCCLNMYMRVGRTRREQKINDMKRLNDDIKTF